MTKGIVPSGRYTFSAANQTITFSSDYAGMSLSDITYITNIKSGVATVIYDPFDATKGGELNGLVLTLAYNTTAMADSDPLQIIVGFVAPELPSGEVAEKTVELLQDIADGVDLLAAAADQTEGIQINVNDVSTKKDTTGATILSDGVEIAGRYLKGANETYLVDTTGYNTAIFTVIGNPNCSLFVVGETSMDGKNGQPVQTYSSNAGSAPVTNIPNSSLSVGASTTLYVTVYNVMRYTRLRVSSYSAGGCHVTCYLRNVHYGAYTPNGPNVNALFNNSAPFGYANINTNVQTTASGGLGITGLYAPSTNVPGISPVTTTNVPFPIGIGGREQGYAGALAGVFRYITVDSNGRYILGTDYGSTPQGTAPPRGVGGRPNSMQGSQALLVEDIGQSEGDTTPMLLQQILVELKMLNQQINELPLTMNLGFGMQNEVQDYRNEEYNNHVNNQ